MQLELPSLLCRNSPLIRGIQEQRAVCPMVEWPIEGFQMADVRFEARAIYK